jgi:hypothetical protein
VAKVDIHKDPPSYVQNAELLEKALAKYKKNRKNRLEFLKDFGDAYVSGVMAGGAFYGAIFVECMDENYKKEISANLRGKINAGLLNIEAGGDFQKHVTEAVKNSYISIQGHVLGDKPDKLPGNIDQMARFALTYPKRVKDKNSQVILKAVIEDYRSVDLDDDFADINKDRKQMIAKCSILKSKIISTLKTINYIAGHPEIYPDQDPIKLLEYEEKLDTLLCKIYDRVLVCLGDPGCNSNTDDLKLPEMKFPKPVSKISRGPISAKYDVIEGNILLGKPITDEKQSLDQKGKYRLYENGGIFWHPDLGAREVHGAIFCGYRSSNLNEGNLGYPKSDEHWVPGGYRRNVFEKGRIIWHEEWNEIEEEVDKSATNTMLKIVDDKKILDPKIRPKSRLRLAKNLYVEEITVKYPYLSQPSLAHTHVGRKGILTKK